MFPRITNATPHDELCFYDLPPLLGLPEIDEVHVSVTFTYDRAVAEFLAEQWRYVGVPVKVGGPAYDDPGGAFIPGRYVRKGLFESSRGCDNNCWFCSVPKREGKLRELEVTEGWNVLDNNILGCSECHIRKVFEMLKTQPHRPIFTGGLEAKLLKPWHVELLRSVKPERMYFAYDTPDDYEPLVEAGRLLWNGGFTISSHVASCYVLIGYKGDTFEKAEKRIRDTIKAGFVPYAMLYKDKAGTEDKEWRKFQRLNLNPTIVCSRLKELSSIQQDIPSQPNPPYMSGGGNHQAPLTKSTESEVHAYETPLKTDGLAGP